METLPDTNTPRPRMALVTIVGILGAMIAVGAYLVAANYGNFWPYGAEETIACTMEAKICPDGTGVGRTGPNCEFAACPESTSYLNNQYGLRVTLPMSWKGYSVVTESLEIRAISTNAVVGTAPVISVRNPLWTTQVPRQDIPIQVYTLTQWDKIVNEQYSVGAAPFPPSELASNSRYVFALPARYNYGFLVGFEEVEQILAARPVTAFEPTTGTTSGSGISGTVLVGPTCPVVRENDLSCDDKPYQGQFIVRNATGNAEVTRFSTDSLGRFQIALAVGNYLVEPVERIGMGNQSQIVDVKAGAMTEIVLTFDTGIR